MDSPTLAPHETESKMSDASPIGHTSVGIVIPVHNEAGFLTSAIEMIAGELSRVPATLRLYLVENGSTDATAELVEQVASEHDWITASHLAKPDYGAALRAGFRLAVEDRPDWIVNFDIDYFSGTFVEHLLRPDTEADVVIASKRAPGSDDRRSPTRRLATFAFNIILRVVLHSGVSDTHGIKGFRRDVVAKLIDSVGRDEDLFDTELVLRAERAGFQIAEVPVVVEERRVARSSLLKRVPRTLRGIMALRRSLDRESV